MHGWRQFFQAFESIGGALNHGLLRKVDRSGAAFCLSPIDAFLAQSHASRTHHPCSTSGLVLTKGPGSHRMTRKPFFDQVSPGAGQTEPMMTTPETGALPPGANVVKLSQRDMLDYRAVQRTFDGAYARTALGQLCYATIILRLFQPKFFYIGKPFKLLLRLWIATGKLTLLCARHVS